MAFTRNSSPLELIPVRQLSPSCLPSKVCCSFVLLHRCESDFHEVSGASSDVTLSDALLAMPSDALGRKLNNLKKDLLSKIIEPLLSHKASVEIRPLKDTQSPPKTCRINLATSKNTDPLQPLHALLQYTHHYLEPTLPSPHRDTFFPSLYKPITEALLSILLRPSIPNTLSGLPNYLKLVASAVEFERQIEADFGIAFGKGKVIDEWSQDVGGHFERRRRETIISGIRDLIQDPEGDEDGVGIRVEEELPTPLPTPAPYSESESSSVSSAVVVEGSASSTEDQTDDSAWDFDDPTPQITESAPQQPPETGEQVVELDADAEEAWGFGDDGPSPASPAPKPSEQEVEPDPWGWSEDAPQPPKSPPKQARGLEKFSAGKSSSSGASPSNSGLKTSSSPIASQSSLGASSRDLVTGPPALHPTPQLETYLISPSAQQILALVEKTLLEGRQLMESEYVPCCLT